MNYAMTRAFRTQIRESLREYIKPEDTVVDVGACIGEFTIPMAELVPKGRVIAIEPGPRVREVLAAEVDICRRVYEIFGQVEIVPRAVGAEPGVGRFYHYHHWTLLPESDTRNPDHVATGYGTEEYKEAQAFAVEIEPLDSILARLDARAPSFVKIDVDGWELAVLRGMRKTLEARPVVLIEFGPYGMRAVGHNTDTFVGDLFGLSGYKVHVWQGSRPGPWIMDPLHMGGWMPTGEDSIDLLLVPEVY